VLTVIYARWNNAIGTLRRSEARGPHKSTWPTAKRSDFAPDFVFHVHTAETGKDCV
jgi:hypothetical protein